MQSCLLHQIYDRSTFQTHNEQVCHGDVEGNLGIHDVKQGLMDEVHAETETGERAEGLPREKSVDETYEVKKRDDLKR